MTKAYPLAAKILMEEANTPGMDSAIRSLIVLYSTWDEMSKEEKINTYDLVKSYYRLSVKQYRQWKKANNKPPYKQWEFERDIKRLQGECVFPYAPPSSRICTLGNFYSLQEWVKAVVWIRRKLR